jgi:hypothetical protein
MSRLCPVSPTLKASPGYAEDSSDAEVVETCRVDVFHHLIPVNYSGVDVLVTQVRSKLC